MKRGYLLIGLVLIAGLIFYVAGCGNSGNGGGGGGVTKIKAPSNLTATAVSGTEIDLVWADNSAHEDGFKVERATDPAGTWVEIKTVTTDGTTVSDTGLDPLTTYYYRARAYRGTKLSDYSNQASDATLGAVVLTNFDLSGTPSGIAITPDGQFLYISQDAISQVSVIRTSDNGLETTVGVGTSPETLAILPDGSKAYVPNASSGNVSVINLSTNTVTSTITTGNFPNAVKPKHDSSRVYVTNANSGNVSVIQTSSDTVLTNVTVGSYPNGLAITADDSTLYVVNGISQDLYMIDTGTNTVTDSAPFIDAGSPTLNRADSFLFAAASFSDLLYEVNTTSLLVADTIKVGNGNGGHDSARSPSGFIWVLDRADNQISIVNPDTLQVVQTLKPIGGEPVSIAFSLVANRAYVTNWASNKVTVIDTAGL